MEKSTQNRILFGISILALVFWMCSIQYKINSVQTEFHQSLAQTKVDILSAMEVHEEIIETVNDKVNINTKEILKINEIIFGPKDE